MGGCSSKPQTADCGRVEGAGLLFHTGLKTSNSSAHQTLESLFNQHGRDGENLLEDAQTLHELLLHAGESKEPPDSQNQRAGNTDSVRDSPTDMGAPPCKLNSPISHAAEKDASECTKMEGTQLNVAEFNAETEAKVESSVSNQVLTKENAENGTQLELCSMANLAESNEAKGADNLEGSKSGHSAAAATDEKCGKLEATLLDLPEENHIEGADGLMSDVAEENLQENAGKSNGFVPNLAEVKLQEECGLSKFAEGNGVKLESGSSPRSLNLEPKLDLLEKPESATASDCVEYASRGFTMGPKSENEKIPEPNLLESIPTEVVQAPDSMSGKEADLQGANDLAIMEGVIERDEIATETDKIPKQEEKCEKNEKAVRSEDAEERLGEAMEGEETEHSAEDKKPKMQCAQIDVGSEKGESSHNGERSAELQNEKAMDGEPLKVQFESGLITSEPGENAEEENASLEKTEEAMEAEKVHMQNEEALEGRKAAGVQDEKPNREDAKTGVRNEGAFDGEAEKPQREDEDEEAVHIEKLVDVVEDKVNVIEAADELGLNETVDGCNQKKLACTDSMTDEVADFELTEKPRDNQKDHDAEKLEDVQKPIQELHLIASTDGRGSADDESEEHNASALCSFPETTVLENLPSATPTVRGVEVEELVVASPAIRSTAEENCMECECVVSKPNQEPKREGEHDTNEIAHMEASNQ